MWSWVVGSVSSKIGDLVRGKEYSEPKICSMKSYNFDDDFGENAKNKTKNEDSDNSETISSDSNGVVQHLSYFRNQKIQGVYS